MDQDTMRAALTDAERAQVDALLAAPFEAKPVEDYQAGEFITIAGTIPLGQGRRLSRGVYQVMRWHPDYVELMRYKTKTRIEVPHGLTLSKYPIALLVLSERAADRVIVCGRAAA